MATATMTGQEVPPPVSTKPAMLRLENIHKTFGGVVAIKELSLELRSGEIVALVGDNVAGKSTLVNIISGIHKPTSGRIILDGNQVFLPDASAARKAGIEVVHQDLALASNQPVYMNLFLGREIVRKPLPFLARKVMITETQQLIDDLDVRLPSPRLNVRNLSGGQRQAVAIARALHWASKCILLDEPTAALGVAETSKVELLISNLREKNLAVLMISHNLEQVLRLADRICVLRRGEQAGVFNTVDVDEHKIVSTITGVS